MQRQLVTTLLVVIAAGCGGTARNAAPTPEFPSAPTSATQPVEPDRAPPRPTAWIAPRLQSFAQSAARRTGRGWQRDFTKIREWLESRRGDVDSIALQEATAYLDALERELAADGPRESSFALPRFSAVTRRELALSAGDWPLEQSLITGLAPADSVVELHRIARVEDAPEAWRSLAAICLFEPSVSASCVATLEDCVVRSLDGGTGSCALAQDRARRRLQVRHCSGADLRPILLVPSPPREDVPPVIQVDEDAPGRSTLHLGGRPMVLTGYAWDLVVDGQRLGSASWAAAAFGLGAPRELVTDVPFDQLCRTR